MNNRIWIIGISALSVVVLALGWVLGASPVLTQASSNREQKAAVDETNVAHEAKLVTLKEQFESVDEIEADLRALRVQVPPTTEYPALLRQLSVKAGDAGVRISSTSFEAAAAFAPVPEVEGTTEPVEAAETPVVDPATPAPVVAIPVTLAVAGSYEGFMSFVAALQSDGRLFLVTGLSITSGSETAEGATGEFTGTVNGLIYVVRDATVGEE